MIVVYLLICTVRLTMPGLIARDRNSIFGLRVGIALLGALAGYAFLFACFKSKGHLIHDPENAQHIGDLIFLLFAATGEFVARRKLRTLNFVHRNKKIPWTY